MPPGCEQQRDAADEVVDVRHLGQHVGAENEVGAHPLCDEPLRELDAEELDEGRHAACLRRRRDVRRGIDPEHRDPLRHEVLQEVPVVRCELDHEAVRAEAEAVGDHVDVPPRMLDPRVGVRREVRVLGEDLVRCHERRQLREPARRAHANVERVERLHLLDAIGGQEALAQR